MIDHEGSVARGHRLADRLRDAALGAAVAGTLAVVVSADHGGRLDPDGVAYAWALGSGALMLARRQYPVLVVWVTVLGLFAYYAAGYPAVGVAVPVTAALFSAAQFGRLRWAVAAAAVVLGASVGFRLADGQPFSFVVGYELAGHLLLTAAAIALGDSVHSRRQADGSRRRLLALTAERARGEAEARARQHRVALARDLHDSIGHSTAVISLHAQVAREALPDDQAAARASLDVVHQAAATAMADLRRTVELLKGDDSPAAAGPITTSAQLTTIVDATRGSGIDVSSAVDLPTPLPDDVGTAVLRIVQEGLTNVLKHSAATRAEVSVTHQRDVLHVSVVDDGTAPARPAAGGPGHGIAGLRERATALGGSFSAGPESAGFAVRATIPLPPPTSTGDGPS